MFRHEETEPVLVGDRLVDAAGPQPVNGDGHPVLAEATAILIRCHFLDAGLLDLAHRLSFSERYDVIFAVDQSSGVSSIDGFTVLPLSADRYRRLGLLVEADDMMWSCGDYVLYVARLHLPGYNRFWMIEYDVVINRPDPAGFLAQIDSVSDADFVGSYLRPAEPDWHWSTSLRDRFPQVHRCFFPLVRVSARAIDFLLDLRVHESGAWCGNREEGDAVWPNDEAFVATLLCNGGYSCADLNEFGQVYGEDSFGWYKPFHLSALPPHDGRLYHPVRTGQSYLHAVSRHRDGDPALLISLVDQDWTAAEAEQPLALTLASRLAGCADDPAVLFAEDTCISAVLRGYPVREGVRAVALALADARLVRCLDRLRDLAAEAGWPGTDMLENLALGKPTRQSSVSEWSLSASPERDAEGANNGRLQGDYGFHTRVEDSPWWMVDLLEGVHLSRVVIYNRAAFPDRLGGFVIELSTDGRAWRTAHEDPGQQQLDDVVTVTLRETVPSRFIRVRLPRRGVLHFLELQAFGGRSARREVRAAARTHGRPARSGIGYRSWNAIRNVGDAIAPYLVEWASGAEPYYAAADRSHLLCIGSILFMANENSIIWGCGTLNPQVYLPELKGSQFRAVRGRKTADALTRRGVVLPDMPFGDPGILVHELLEDMGEMPARPGKRIAVIPHHSAIEHPFYQELLHSDEVQLVNICDDTLLPLRQIAEADVVVSQSLHGLIFAESFGKPTAWIGDAMDENAVFKYHDWHSVMENAPRRPYLLGEPLDVLVKKAERQHSLIDRSALKAAFPAAEMAREAPLPSVAFRTCRAHAPFVFLLPRRLGEAQSGFKSFLDRAQAAADSLFESWAERPYALAVEPEDGNVPHPAQAAIIAREMDGMFRTDVAILAPRQALEAAGPALREYDQGVARFEALPDRVSAMLLRPLYERPVQSFAVFGI